MHNNVRASLRTGFSLTIYRDTLGVQSLADDSDLLPVYQILHSHGDFQLRYCLAPV
jgi:hypothetical protein